MTLAILILAIVGVCFGLVVIIGPPFLPTLRPNIAAALDLLDLHEGQTLLELGSGDGRVMRAAAERGWKVVGVEINPFLVFVSWLRCWRYRHQVRIIWGDIWKVRWPHDVDGIFTFLLQRQMERLDKRIVTWQTRPIRLASFAFSIAHKNPMTNRQGVFLYEYSLPKAKKY